MRKLIRALGQYAVHPFSRWERLYARENPWCFDTPSEIHRFEETNRIIRENIGPLETILEIGTVRGVDISLTAVERANRRFANNPKAAFSPGKLPDIAFDQRFDLVTAFEIIYYVKDIPRALATMDRLGRRRMASVHWPQVRMLEQFLFPTRNASRQTITWQGQPRWLVAWW